MTLSLLSAILYAAWVRAHKETDWYLGFERQTPLNPALAFFTFIILYNNLIPISLIITLDIVKYVVLLTTMELTVSVVDACPAFAVTAPLPALLFIFRPRNLLLLSFTALAVPSQVFPGNRLYQ